MWLGRLRASARRAGRARCEAEGRQGRSPARAAGRRRWGREGTSRHIRRARRAAATLTLDPQPRYEMAHWHAMAAAWLRRGGAWDWKEEGGGGPAENAANGLEACGLVLSVMFSLRVSRPYDLPGGILCLVLYVAALG